MTGGLEMFEVGRVAEAGTVVGDRSDQARTGLERDRDPGAAVSLAFLSASPRMRRSSCWASGGGPLRRPRTDKARHHA